MIRSPYYQSVPTGRGIEPIRAYKMRTLLCCVCVTTSILVILSLSHASPIPSVSSNSTVEETSTTTTEPETATILPTIGYLNGSKLVITNVVKTLQFDVAILDDSDNSTESPNDSSTPYVEADINVLDPKLLINVVHSLTLQQDGDKSTDGTQASSGNGTDTS